MTDKIDEIYTKLYFNLQREDRYVFARNYTIQVQFGEYPFFDFDIETYYSIYDIKSQKVISSNLSEKELIQECKELVFSKSSILSSFKYGR